MCRPKHGRRQGEFYTLPKNNFRYKVVYNVFNKTLKHKFKFNVEVRQ